MRTVTVGLLLLCLVLGAVTPAIAQTADPLGLISFGALIPYLGSGAPEFTSAMSLLLISSPVGGELLHMFLFDNTCTRSGPSLSVSLTANDVGLLRIDNIGSGIPTQGLVAIASTDAAGFSLVPLSNPIHARVQWVNPEKNFIRNLEPIAIQNAEALDTSQVWNPLRTAASFFALPETATSKSTLFLICPTKSVTTGAFPPALFPRLLPKPVVSGPTPIQIRVYDDDEGLLLEFASTCSCLSQILLKTLNPIYGDLVSAPFGTYTEIEGGAQENGFYSFTGYLATKWEARDSFARLHNGNVLSLRGTLTPGSR